jgi:hypothetical protein
VKNVKSKSPRGKITNFGDLKGVRSFAIKNIPLIKQPFRAGRPTA